MKKWIGLATGLVCIFTSPLQASPAQVETTQVIPAEPDNSTSTNQQAAKQVGKASVDGTNTAQTNSAGKYILAATAVAVGITALILVSKHDGHK